jgi:hypothetical protein
MLACRLPRGAYEPSRTPPINAPVLSGTVPLFSTRHDQSLNCHSGLNRGADNEPD